MVCFVIHSTFQKTSRRYRIPLCHKLIPEIEVPDNLLRIKFGQYSLTIVGGWLKCFGPVRVKIKPSKSTTKILKKRSTISQ